MYVCILNFTEIDPEFRIQISPLYRFCIRIMMYSKIDLGVVDM